VRSVETLLGAGVPLVRLCASRPASDEAPEPLATLPSEEMHVAITLLGRTAVANTALVRAYVDIDPRVRELCLFVKHWARRRRLNSPMDHYISPYTWVLLCISYLQIIPSIGLPVLQATDAIADLTRHNGQAFDCSFQPCDASTKKRIGASPVTLGQLVYGFFRYWHGVQMQFGVVSVRHGGLLPEHRVPWAAGSFFAIEDPFESGVDLGRFLNAHTMAVLQAELGRAENMLSLAGVSTLSDVSLVPAISVLNRVCEEKQVELLPTW